MNTTTLAIIVGMALVTYIPRALPGLLLERYHLPPRAVQWLRQVPYAALGALIFPGIVQGEKPLVGVVSGLTAALLGWLGVHLVLVMGITIVVALLVSPLL